MASIQMKASLATSLLVAALSLACQDEPEPSECSVLTRDVWHDELFDVFAYGHDFSPFCSAGFELAHEHAQWVADAWGEPPLEFDYGLFDSRQDPCWPCSQGSLGCAFSDNMAATDLPQRHEIAHAVRRYPCPALLEEGWATLYGDPFSGTEVVGDLRQAADSVQSGKLAGELYPIAARFVAFLLETHGLDGLKALCEFSIKDSESLNSALIEVFNQSLDEIEAEFADYPDWEVPELRQDRACEDSEVTTAPGTWTIDLVCGGAGVEGREGGVLMTHHVVELPQPGTYGLRFETSVDFHVRVELRSCTRDGMASIFYYPYEIYGLAGDSKELVISDLPAGKLVVRVMLRDSAESLTLDMGMEPWP